MEKVRVDPRSSPGWDPVCGMLINARSARASRRYEGRDIYFCSGGCVRRFDAGPARYVRSKYMREYMETEDAGREVAPSATTGVPATVDGLVRIELPLTGGLRALVARCYMGTA
jgi:YHS domain-containing protein